MAIPRDGRDFFEQGLPVHGAAADFAVMDTLRDIRRFLVDAVHDVWTWLVETEDLVIVRIVASVLILIATVLASRIAKRSLESSARRTAQRNRLDDWQTRALISRSRPIAMVAAIGLYIAMIIVLLAVWRLQTAFLSILTAAGFAGIVIGIAAANSLSNLISGFMIFYNHPFDIGDWVEIEDLEGIVIDVKPGATVIESWDGEKITYPNRIIEGTRIKNKSHQRKLRIRFPIGVDYATDITKAREILLGIISKHPEVLGDPEPQVIAMGFGDSAIQLEVRYWIAPLRSRYLLIQTWFMQEVQRAFAREGIVIPFPQRTVVWRYHDGNAPPGQTVSELAYEPEHDTKPMPGPPLGDPVDTTSPYARQNRPRQWFEKVWEKGHLRRPQRKAGQAQDPVEGQPRSASDDRDQETSEKDRQGGQGRGANKDVGP